MILLVILLIGVAVAVGVTAGWQWVAAPLLAAVLLWWSIGSLRALVADGRRGETLESGPVPVGAHERTLFWCEECGTEVLLIVRGTPRAPSHCGQRMHERTEILN